MRITCNTKKRNKRFNTDKYLIQFCNWISYLKYVIKNNTWQNVKESKCSNLWEINFKVFFLSCFSCLQVGRSDGTDLQIHRWSIFSFNVFLMPLLILNASWEHSTKQSKKCLKSIFYNNGKSVQKHLEGRAKWVWNLSNWEVGKFKNHS